MSLIELIETTPLPAELLLPLELRTELVDALEGAVYELVEDLEVMIPILHQALLTGDDSNILDAFIQFCGKCITCVVLFCAHVTLPHDGPNILSHYANCISACGAKWGVVQPFKLEMCPVLMRIVIHVEESLSSVYGVWWLIMNSIYFYQDSLGSKIAMCSPCSFSIHKTLFVRQAWNNMLSLRISNL